ncbi:MAG TPA: zinc-ribbon domain containing protein [Candidatus Bathyarchaeia archaeon]|nr:zinc-ribbon domain containing protein [Candidatus Bathyarchaeia archaeon]
MQNEKIKDQIIKCIDCQQEFAWTEDEQLFFRQKRLDPPVRCPICRACRSAAQKDKFRGKINSLT